MRPNPLLSFIFIFARVFIFIKLSTLLILTSFWPEIHSLSELTWWVYFLIFDIWVMSLLPTPKEIEETENKEK